MYACKFQFQHLNPFYVHGAFCPGCVLIGLLVASSSSAEGRGHDRMVSERHGCNNGPLWAIRSAVTEAGLPSTNRNLMAASFKIHLSG